jgi:zinc protease
MRWTKIGWWAGVWFAGLAVAQAAELVPESNLVLLPAPSDPTVSFRLWFRVGSQNDPPGKEGLAALTASMLTEASTQQNPYERILERLYPMAAGYSAAAGVEMTVVSGRVHRDNLDEYYRLLVEAIRTPAFKQEDLDRLKSEVLDFLENTLRYSSDEELGKAVLYNEVYAGTPYGHLPAGTINGIRSITREDIRQFYRTHYTRDNVVVGLGGGYDARLVQRLRGDLGQLPGGQPPQVPPPTPQPIRGLRVTIVEKEANATGISLGYPLDLLRGPRAWYALAVANSWLGEHRQSSSHLFQVIREQRGLNYGDYSYIEHYPRGGMLQKPPQNVCRRRQLFEIWIRPVPNETRHFALRAALRELKKLADGGLTAEQFDLQRNFLRNYVLHYAPTTSERLGYAVDDRFYGISGSHLENYRRAMGDMALAEVNAAVKQHLQCENLQIVLVTRDAKALKEALVANTPSPIRYATPKPDAVLAEDRLISTFPLKVAPEAVKIVAVTDLFAR